MATFQEMIMGLTRFWAGQGCVVHQGYDLEVGAGTFNPATFLRCLGPEPYAAVYVEPSRRPKDGRFGENPNRLQFYHQMQVILKPSPSNILDLYLLSLESIGLHVNDHDIRFVHDDWENPTIGAWGLGWEVWADGMEVTQFTYFQSVGGLPVKPVSGEITYGLERLAMYLQGVDSIFDLQWNETLTYGDIYKRSEWEWSHYNFHEANTGMWLRHFDDFEGEAQQLVAKKLPLPAYDFVMKSSHAFNILDARGSLSVTERARYMGRIRHLARAIAECYLHSREQLNFPLLLPPLPVPKVNRASIVTPTFATAREDFLLEVGCEELPATFVPIGLRGLEQRLSQLLTREGIAYERLEVYGTPRRLAALVRGLVVETTAQTKERKGPSVQLAFDATGLPTKVGEGFFHALGLPPHLEQPGIEVREGYVYATLTVLGKKTYEVLATHLAATILGIEFPKTMRWGDFSFSFARPIRWLIALLGTEIIPLTIGDVHAGRISRGHRQLSPDPFSVGCPKDYLAMLRERHVLADVAERRQAIVDALPPYVLGQERVLPQVTHLVEYPFVIEGSFDPAYLQAPQEVLMSEMIEHQKYFPVGDAHGLLTSSFCIVSNQRPTPLIRSGHEKALSPRLADGVFLYEEDVKIPLVERHEQLKKITDFAPLGSLFAKTKRLVALVELIYSYLASDCKNLRTDFCGQVLVPGCKNIHELGSDFSDQQSAEIDGNLNQVVESERTTGLEKMGQVHENFCGQVLEDGVRAAWLSRCDLATLLVNEFPELQGTIGKLYARKQGEKESVALALDEQWMPRGENAPLPTTAAGILLSLASKFDALLSCFALGLKPTSSSDPYALRRHAFGMVKIAIEHHLDLPLRTLFEQACDRFLDNSEMEVALRQEIRQRRATIVDEVMHFIHLRTRSVLHDMGFAKDEIEAGLACNSESSYDLFLRLQALHDVRNQPFFASLLEVATRTRKILASQSGQERALEELRHPAEQALLTHIERVQATLSADYRAAFASLATLHRPVSDLFEAVKILDDDLKVRRNRLALLQRVYDLCSRIVDLSKLN